MTIEEVKTERGMMYPKYSDEQMLDWLIEEHDRLTAANKVLTEAVEWGVEAFRDYGKNNRAELLKKKANL